MCLCIYLIMYEMYSSYKHFIYEFLWYLLNSLLIYLTERREHTHTAPTHVNRQT